MPRIVEGTEVRSSRYTGFGPEIGVNYETPISDDGIGIFGSALGSVLFGKQRTNTVGTLTAAGISNYRDTHTAYTVDAKAGLSYTLPTQHLKLAVGYGFSWLGGVRDSHNAVSATGLANYGDHSADLFYHGPFASITLSLP